MTQEKKPDKVVLIRIPSLHIINFLVIYKDYQEYIRGRALGQNMCLTAHTIPGLIPSTKNKQTKIKANQQDYKWQTKPKPKLTTAVSLLTCGTRTDKTVMGLGGGGMGGEWDSKTFSSQVLDELMGYATLFYLATNFLVLKGRNLIGQCNLT